MKSKPAWYGICFIFCIGIITLGYYLPRSYFYTNLFIFSTLFIFYGFFYREAGSDRAIRKLLFLAVLVRLLLFFSLPSWSEDYVRFIWDGQLGLQGTSPYLLKPPEVLTNTPDKYLEQLYPMLNSSEYYTVYPPSNQLIFTMAVWLAGEDLLTTVIVIRLFLLGFELLTFYLILKMLGVLGLPQKKVLLYALNPLVIMEIVGNLHFEGIMLSFILTGLLFLIMHKHTLSGMALGVAVAIKLSPLILVPSFLQHLPRGGTLRFCLGVLLMLIIGFFPLLGSNFYSRFFESLGLFANYFEFNASIYYIIRQVGYWWEGYNIIVYWGPILKMLALLMILFISFREKKSESLSLIHKILAIYWIFLLSSTVIHPWYIIPAFGISLFTNHSSFLIWTYLIFFSYHAYQQEPYQEKTWLLVLEYVVLMGAIFADYKVWWRENLSK